MAMGVYSFSLSLSLTHGWGAGSSSLADVEKRGGVGGKCPSREALGSKPPKESPPEPRANEPGSGAEKGSGAVC